MSKKILYLYLFVCSILNCQTSNNIDISHGDLYLIRNIDSTTFCEFYFIPLQNKKAEIFYLISSKYSNKEKIPFKNFEPLTLNHEYTLNLKKLKKLVKATTCDISGYKPYIYLDKHILWYNDTIRIQLYQSDNVFDRYVELN